MKRRYGFILLFTILVISGISIAYVKLFAQKTPQGLMVVPTNFELEVNPGKATTRKISLYNMTNADVNIEVKTRNFTAQGEEGNVALTGTDTPYSLANWIKITPERIKIPSKKNHTFEFTITPPANAEPGGHFGSIIFATVPDVKLNQTGAVVTQEIGALILSKVPGPVNEEANLESFTTDKNFYIQGPVKFTSRVKNNSSVHIKPVGTIEIKDLFGGRDVIPVEGQNILPGVYRKIYADWKSNFMIGKYTANASLFYGASNKTLTAKVEFWAFPVKEAAIALAVLIILFLFRKRLLKAFKVIVIGK